jgi:hypothetical protein
MTRYQAQLSQQDVEALCCAARLAWRQAPPTRRRVAFVWRGKCFVASHSTFQLRIRELNGAPVAAMWD